MREYNIIELKNGSKYLIIDMVNMFNKKHFLLSKINGLDLDYSFDICMYNDSSNSFIEMEDEYQYNNIKEIFDKRLEELRKKLDKVDFDKISVDDKIIKLKLVDINDYDYTFERLDGSKLIINMELFDNFKLQINDYLYIKESTVNENITVRFGNIYTDKTELIKVVRNNNIFYLQRYYG